MIDSVEENEDYITVSATHIWYQLLKNYTKYKPDETTKVSGYSACKNVMEQTVSPVQSFNVESDIDTLEKGLDYQHKNLVEAFLDPENGICAKYHGVLLRDNWDFYVIKDENIGYDRGFVVEYGQNLLNVERSESTENVATRIVPFGKDSKGDPVYMTGTPYIDSDYINDYPIPMVELLDCSGTCTIGKDGTTAQNITEKLRAEAQKRFDDDKVDIPEVEMTINFVSLGDTDEYVQYRGLDKVYLYDKITVKDKVRGYNYTAEVNYVKHNVITGCLEEIKIGSINDSDGTRKIATWQVPSVNGENIRLKSIRLGAFENGAVDGDALAQNSIATVHLASATIDDLTAESLTAVEAQIEDLIAGKVTAQSIVAGSITADKIAGGKITADWMAANSITAENAAIANGTIGNAHINSAGIDYAKIKELNAQSAFFGEAVFQKGVGEKLYVPRLLFDTAQGRQAVVQDLVIGASDGYYYSLDITETEDGFAMTPTRVTVSTAEKTAGHTNDGRAIIGTTATYNELATEDLFAIDAVLDKITAARIDVDSLWARQAFIDALNVQDISSNTYISQTIGGWSAAHTGTITESIAGINSALQTLGRGKIYYSATEPEEPSVGDLWIQPMYLTTWTEVASKTWTQLQSYKWIDLGMPPKQQVWNGNGWESVNDSSMYSVLQTQIFQTEEKINLKASQSDVTALGQQVAQNTAQIEIYADSITQEVEARVAGDTAAQAYAQGAANSAEENAKAASIQKTTQYQTADSIVNSAKSYTNEQLQSYSTITQTSSAITAEVSKIIDGTTTVGKLVSSKVTIDANGIQLKTSGTFTVAGNNFSIDSSGNVTMKGNVQASSGTIGGWTIGATSIHAGSGSNYVSLSTGTQNTYFMWAGASSAANAPFKVTKDGTIYSTKLITTSEQGQSETVSLSTYPLWKLNYSTIKGWTVSGGSVTISTTGGDITFNSAASVSLTGSWSGNTFTVTASNDSIAPVTAQFSASSGTGTSARATYNIETFNSSNKAHFWLQKHEDSQSVVMSMPRLYTNEGKQMENRILSNKCDLLISME